MSEKSGCGVSIETVRFTDPDFADEAFVYAETTEVGAVDSLSEEEKPHLLRVSWIKTMVQSFDDILDETVESIPVNGGNVKVTQTFPYLGSVIHSSTSCEPKVIIMERDEFAGRSCMALPILVQKGPSLSLAGPPGLASFL